MWQLVGLILNRKLVNSIMKIFVALLFSFSMALPALADDVSSNFLPESGEPIEINGQLDSGNLSCDTATSGLSCAEAFDKVHGIIAGNFAGTIPGFIDEVGKGRRHVIFTVGLLNYAGKDVRMIFEYNETRDATGVIWVDPLQF